MKSHKKPYSVRPGENLPERTINFFLATQYYFRIYPDEVHLPQDIPMGYYYFVQQKNPPHAIYIDRTFSGNSAHPSFAKRFNLDKSEDVLSAGELIISAKGTVEGWCCKTGYYYGDISLPGSIGNDADDTLIKAIGLPVDKFFSCKEWEETVVPILPRYFKSNGRSKLLTDEESKNQTLEERQATRAAKETAEDEGMTNSYRINELHHLLKESRQYLEKNPPIKVNRRASLNTEPLSINTATKTQAPVPTNDIPNSAPAVTFEFNSKREMESSQAKVFTAKSPVESAPPIPEHGSSMAPHRFLKPKAKQSALKKLLNCLPIKKKNSK